MSFRVDSSHSDLAARFHQDGFVVVPQVFEPRELHELAEHVRYFRQPSAEALARYGAEPLDLFGRSCLNEFTAHELRISARLLRLHLFDPRTRALMLDARLFALVRTLWPGEPLAVHALYFPKPPGARGFPLHADTGYLPTDPPEMAGCFVAVDDTDEQNGALSIIPGSHRFGAVERQPVSTDEFVFPEGYVQPAGTELCRVHLKAGDVLIFHGGTLHASDPNRSAARWRRAFICHYISAAVRSVSEYFNPAFRATGEEIPAPGHASARQVA